jgi:hypothetical protein
MDLTVSGQFLMAITDGSQTPQAYAASLLPNAEWVAGMSAVRGARAQIHRICIHRCCAKSFGERCEHEAASLVSAISHSPASSRTSSCSSWRQGGSSSGMPNVANWPGSLKTTIRATPAAVQVSTCITYARYVPSWRRR